jgi:hypothetical protein
LGKGWGGGKGCEMTQTLYAHMNKRKKNKVDFRPKLVRRHKESHFILIKGAIHEDEITINNLYTPNVIASYFIKHSLMVLKTQIDPQHSGTRRL